ncbi:MAG: Asp23/Gls24 family envelope stress response protein [Candidatus Omnitrophota bacterium]|nr:Asp23/Gls24 family envelope stress response protein [Candidatus Omnitrophota bacterium]
MDRNISSEFGQIKIHRKVIREVAEAAAASVKGVRLVGWECSGPFRGGVLKFFGIPGTKVQLDKEIKIVVPITVAWGENVVDVACEVQKKVIYHMQNNLNIDSINVDVKIKRVERG